MPQIQVWINNDKPENVAKIVKTLNDWELAHKEQRLKTFVIFVTDDSKAAEAQLTALAEKEKTNDICLAYIEPKNEAVEYYRVNLDPEVKNTVMMYRKKVVTAKQVNVVADEKGIASLQKDVDALLK